MAGATGRLVCLLRAVRPRERLSELSVAVDLGRVRRRLLLAGMAPLRLISSSAELRRPRDSSLMVERCLLFASTIAPHTHTKETFAHSSPTRVGHHMSGACCADHSNFTTEVPVLHPFSAHPSHFESLATDSHLRSFRTRNDIYISGGRGGRRFR